VRRIGRIEAQTFYSRHYEPNNAILVVAGDITLEELRADAEATYAKLSARSRAPRFEFAQPQRLGETRMMILNAEAKFPYFERSYRVKSYAEAAPGEAEALDVLAQFLGADQSGALYRSLVVERRLATEAGATYDGMARDSGEVSIYAVPRPGVPLDVLERAADQVIARIAAAPVKAPDLARAKTQLVASAVYRRDSQYELASAYGQALAIGLTIDDVDMWPSRIRAVTAEDIQQIVKSDLIKREAVTGYLVPQAPK
jgi:zinc protease